MVTLSIIIIIIIIIRELPNIMSASKGGMGSWKSGRRREVA